MKSGDCVRLCWSALTEHRLRSALSLSGIAIAVASVLLLAAVGQGARGYVVGAFAQFGTNLLQVTPGKTETFGIPGAMGGTSHELSIEDALAVARLPLVRVVVPSVIGEAAVEAGPRSRRVTVIGTTSAALDVWDVRVRSGTFLPEGDPRRGAGAVVLGAELARELFGERPALGTWARAAGRRQRVIGVMAPRGELLGFDMDDLAYVPVATALQLFDQEGLSEIDVTFSHESATEAVAADIAALLRERHGGEDDVTIVTQTAALRVLDDILTGVTVGVSVIAAVSLVVGAIGILTTMWIAVGSRTHEIGLLRAIGATLGEVQGLFLLEAVMLSLAGGATGLAAGYGAAALLAELVPGLPVEPSALYGALALAVSAATGLFAGVAPARHAARLDPLEALRAE